MKPYVGNELFMFASYAHADGETVYPILEKLLERGYRLWYDKAIKPQSYYGEVIADRINESRYFIAFITEHYVNSDYCKQEIKYAEKLKIKILPIFLEEVTLPPWLDFILGNTQAVIKGNYPTEKSFFDAIYSSENINDFLVDDPKKLLSEIEEVLVINNCVPVDKILTAKMTDKVLPFIEKAYDSHFSHVPIVDDEMRCVGVFAHEVWSRFLIDNSKNPNLAFDGTIIFHSLEEYVRYDAERVHDIVFVGKESTIFDLKIKTAEIFKTRHKGVGLFLITENGSTDEPLLGLLTPTGLLGRKILD